MSKSKSLQFKLIAILLLCAVLPLIGMMFFSIINSNDALKKSEANKLTAVRDIKKTQLIELFEGIKTDIIFLADTSNTIKNSTKDFIKYHQEMGIGADEKFDNSSSKPGLTRSYKEIHDPLHSYITKYKDSYGYDDVYIICKKHGHIMYTNTKESDFTENLSAGKYKETHLAEAWAYVVKNDKAYLTDIKRYLPTNNTPAIFMAAPIKDSDETFAILAVRISINKINKIMVETAGMGKTGETYLVGSDYLMRSNSRFIKDKDSSILKQEAKTLSVENIFKNEKGITNIKNYYNAKVLSAYDSIDLFGVKWGIIAEITESEAYEAVNRLTVITLIILSIVLILLIVIGVMFARSISVPISKFTDTLRSSSGQISSASVQLSSSSQEIASGATEQASSIEETSSSMEELSSMVKQNVGNAQEASVIAQKAAEASKDGYAQMEKMLESMNEMNKASTQISKIIKVIDDIAFQTNILALNAAVEAARAGEAGMGFAVVADEVKNLANKSAEAAKETALMIEDSIKRTESGLSVSTKLAEVFKEILTNIQKVSEMSKEVETASKQQDTGINQVNKAIIQFEEVVQGNASASEETASSAEELLAQVETLNDIVGKLAGIITGRFVEEEQYAKHEAIKEIDLKRNENLKQKFKQEQLSHGTTTIFKNKKKRKEILPQDVIPFEEDE